MRKALVWIVIFAVVGVMFVAPSAWQQWVYPCLGAFLFVSLALLKWPACIWDWGLVATASGFLVGVPFIDPLPAFYPACWGVFIVFFVLKKGREIRTRPSPVAGRPSPPAEKPRQGAKRT